MRKQCIGVGDLTRASRHREDPRTLRSEPRQGIPACDFGTLQRMRVEKRSKRAKAMAMARIPVTEIQQTGFTFVPTDVLWTCWIPRELRSIEVSSTISSPPESREAYPQAQMNGRTCYRSKSRRPCPSCRRSSFCRKREMQLRLRENALQERNKHTMHTSVPSWVCSKCDLVVFVRL